MACQQPAACARAVGFALERPRQPWACGSVGPLLLSPMTPRSGNIERELHVNPPALPHPTRRAPLRSRPSRPSRRSAAGRSLSRTLRPLVSPILWRTTARSCTRRTARRAGQGGDRGCAVWEPPPANLVGPAWQGPLGWERQERMLPRGTAATCFSAALSPPSRLGLTRSGLAHRPAAPWLVLPAACWAQLACWRVLLCALLAGNLGGRLHATLSEAQPSRDGPPCRSLP